MIVLIKVIILIIRTITETVVLRMNMTIITVISNQLFGFKGNNDSNDSNNSNSTKSVFRATMRVAISSFWVHVQLQ